MTKTTLFLAPIALTIPLLQAGKPVPRAEALEGSGPALTIRIYNYAGVEAERVLEAAGLAREIYLRSGLETRWVLCELPNFGSQEDEPCPTGAGPDTIRVRILASTPADLPGVNYLVFGYALPGKGGFGTVASVFWDRIAATAELSQVTAAQLLSFVMAHEAGHLLLGYNSHSAEGLMSADWDDERFNRIAQGGVSFIGRQNELLRAGARARVQAATAR